MQIVTNADDFGCSHDTVNATIKCFEAGALTSATIMPKMPATQAAINYAKLNPQFSFGVHLTYVADTVEAPILCPAQVPDLVTSDGLFCDSNSVRVRALKRQIPVEQIAAETAAQIAFIADSGVRISHVDSHGHLHKFACFREALKTVLPAFNITRVRSVQDIYCKRPLKSPTYWLGGYWRSQLRKSFITTDHFFMDPCGEETWPEVLLTKLRGETLEVGAHPGNEEAWRVDERERIQRFAKLAVNSGHRLATWFEVR